MCPDERRADADKLPEPIFTADPGDPDDMAALKRVFGHDALKREFGPGGGGLEQVEYNAAVETFLKFAREALRRGSA